jgi:chromosomal replication initiation ATPase DnaA
MYLYRDIGGYKLSPIASHFGLKRIGSISNTIAKLKSCMERDRKLVDKVSNLSGKYDT